MRIETCTSDRWRIPTAFWAQAAEDISWIKRGTVCRDTSRPPFVRWFPGGVLNTCYNAVDRHIERGRGKQRALIYDSPVTDTVQTFTYLELRDQVARLAGALRAQGVEKGDRVIIYMPAVPDAIFAMLACARHRRRPLGRVRRLRLEGAGDPDRRCEAEADPVGVVRHRGGARRPVQAAARPGDRPREAQAGRAA